MQHKKTIFHTETVHSSGKTPRLRGWLAVTLSLSLLMAGLNLGHADGWLPEEAIDPESGENAYDTSKAPNLIFNTEQEYATYLIGQQFDSLSESDIVKFAIDNNLESLTRDQLLARKKDEITNDVNASLKADKKKKYRVTERRLGGIVNTRHNLTMSYNSAGNNVPMNNVRNNYYEICVYCHTPHGANSTANAPLWNRTVAQRDYILYNQDTSSGSTIFFEPTATDLNYSQPGPNSLTCLSCHDGATAIDSIINMPTQLAGAFRAGYSKDQETRVNASFLDEWSGNKLYNDPELNDPEDNPAFFLATATGDADSANAGHGGFNTASSACLTCHNAGVNPQQGGIGPDFRVLSIGDRFLNSSATAVSPRSNYLADDHPIGVEYPKDFGDNVDYNEPDVTQGRIAYFDLNSNRHADPNEVRLYDTGDGYEVECGSCHDPHGIKITGSTSDELIPSFLRMGSVQTGVSDADASPESNFVSANAGSSLCLTCHVK